MNASAATDLPLPTGGTITTGTELIGIDLDCSQTGWGFTPVIGLDAKLGKLNIGAKYEFKTNLNIENSTKENSLRMIGAAESELADYKHGVNTPNDIPSMLSVAVPMSSYRYCAHRWNITSLMTRMQEWQWQAEVSDKGNKRVSGRY